MICIKKISTRAKILYILVFICLIGISLFIAEYAIDGADWASNKINRHIYSSGTVHDTGTVFDRNGIILAESKDGKRIFNEDKTTRLAVMHIVGDTSGFISTGTHSFYREELSGFDFLSGIYRLKTKGVGNSLQLNIDAKANKVAFNAFDEFNGAIAVYNYKTGALLCSVSKPTYDPENIPKDLRSNEKYDGVFLDKVLSGIYTPGSVMKIITAACAIENIPDIFSRKYNCTGTYKTDDGEIICNGVHPDVDFYRAMNESCNCAFAEIAIELGKDKLLKTAEEFGFNKQLYAGELPLVKSVFADEYPTTAEFAWAGIGQSVTYLNVCHMVNIMGAIANNGKGLSPERIKSKGSVIKDNLSSPKVQITINEQTASVLDEMLRRNVTDKYGENRFPDLIMCGKTGTAQIDGQKSHSWFAGYSKRDDLPLAVVCIAENAGYGSGVATRVSNEVMQYFLHEGTDVS